MLSHPRQAAEADLQPIWQLTGDSVELLERLGLKRDEQDPQLNIHAGLTTLAAAQAHSSSFALIKTPERVSKPLIAFAAAEVFQHADIFDSDAPCLVVGSAFMADFDQEICESCCQLPVKVVMYGSSALLQLTRDELLKQTRPDVLLYAVAPLKTIKARRPTERDDLVFVPGSEQLPPFFRVPWRVGSVFIRDDVHRRLQHSQLRGGQFNLDPSPL
ncbi:hypothetical protein [Deinococcus aquatilis]|uniref:hypothetical protein n=1 Tax=Deinococcus aquatilis TaxID=519440 RepID=UPI00037C2FA1|nr:hypothetical protein [Deinococcus aquatilis]